MVKRTVPAPARPLIAGLAVALAGVIAVAAVLIVGGGASLPQSAKLPAGAPLAVSDSVTPGVVAFGDRVVERAVIALDRSAVQPQTLHFSFGLGRLTSLGPLRISRLIHGNQELVTLSEPAACVGSGCVSSSGVVTLKLPRVSATVTKNEGGPTTVSAGMATLSIRGRVQRSDLAGDPSFAADTTPPAPSYGISPSLLATLLTVDAALAALGAVALAARQVAVLLARRAGSGDADELARAVRLTREAATLPVPQRRRAAGLLARLVPRDELSAKASGLAWSQPEPGGEALSALADDVEQEQAQ